jgi:DNA-binding MarR family transcriptional regulator
LTIHEQQHFVKRLYDLGRKRRAIWAADDRRAPADAVGGGAAANARATVFQYPGPQGARPSELAARLGITKQALNYLLGELERLDYVKRQPDPDDLRSKRVALTRRGASAIRVIREAVAEVETAWAQQLGPERFAQFRALLLELNELP